MQAHMIFIEPMAYHGFILINVILQDQFAKNLRRTVMRYVNLSNILVLRQVSTKIHDQFSTLESLVEQKLLLYHESERLKKIMLKTPHESSWVPLLWAMKLLAKARKDGKTQIEPPAFANLQSAFDTLESKNRRILNFSKMNFPLAYTQVIIFSFKKLFTVIR